MDPGSPHAVCDVHQAGQFVERAEQLLRYRLSASMELVHGLLEDPGNGIGLRDMKEMDYKDNESEITPAVTDNHCRTVPVKPTSKLIAICVCSS